MTSTTAVILAGGKGTRSADPTQAKLAQEIGGQSLMAWHVDILQKSPINEVLVVAGHLGDQVRSLCESLEAHDLDVTVIQESDPQGTVAALRRAAESSSASNFLVLLGDILLSFPIEDFLSSWKSSGKGVGVCVHPSTHPDDSDAVFESFDGVVHAVPKSNRDSSTPNMSSTGVFALSRAAINTYQNETDIGSDLLVSAAQGQDLYAHVSSHYFRDTGTPTRLESAREDCESGAFEQRGQLLPRPAIFLDRDGVINPTSPEVYSASDFTLIPGVAQSIHAANQAGVPVFVVTNQPGIAKGFMTFETHEQIRAVMDQLLGQDGAFIDEYAYCPHYPYAGFEGEVPELKVLCTCRKPEPGLITQLASAHKIDLEKSFMIGDHQRDELAANAAGLPFIYSGQGLELEPPQAILSALEQITC